MPTNQHAAAPSIATSVAVDARVLVSVVVVVLIALVLILSPGAAWLHST